MEVEQPHLEGTQTTSGSPGGENGEGLRDRRDRCDGDDCEADEREEGVEHDPCEREHARQVLRELQREGDRVVLVRPVAVARKRLDGEGRGRR